MISFKKSLTPFKDELYSAMIEAFDCGPFDGGCVVFAQALRDVIGGEVVVLVNGHGRADHAVVHKDGLLYDFDGPLAPKAFMSRFSKNENVDIQSWRPIAPGDLVEAVRDPQLQVRLQELLVRALGGDADVPVERVRER